MFALSLILSLLRSFGTPSVRFSVRLSVRVSGLLFVRLLFRLFLRFCVLSFIFVSLFKANETQELEELKKTKEQTEARLNIQISSLNENLTAARTEAEKFQQQTREAGAKLSEAEKRNDDLKGEIAGNVISILSSSVNGQCKIR